MGSGKRLGPVTGAPQTEVRAVLPLRSATVTVRLPDRALAVYPGARQELRGLEPMLKRGFSSRKPRCQADL